MAQVNIKNHKKRAHHRRFNAHKAHVPSDEMDLLIELINGSDYGWKADTCMLQKHHPMYGAHCNNSAQLAQIYSDEEESTSLKFGTGPEFT
jgi:hypothetical protein